MMGNDYARARDVSAWRRQIDRHWPDVKLRRLDAVPPQIPAGQLLPVRVAATLNGLAPDDVLIECLVGVEGESGEFVLRDRQVFTPGERSESGETLFTLDLLPRLPGLLTYKIRMFPFHPALAHRFEAGYMIWL
jgi:starch phosphorylase